MRKPHHFFNMYLTTTISVAMVLFLIGLECVLLLSANSLINQVKENTTVEIVFTPQAETSDFNRLQEMLKASDYCLDCRIISAEQALKEHIEYLGDDPSKFLGYNPLTASCEMHVKANYGNNDSIAVIESKLTTLPYVEKVIYQKDLLSVLNRNINELSIVLLAVVVLLLFISLALIGNTIRLQIYAQRFLINTMKLVGATSWMIKAPILRKNMTMGFVAAILALGAVSAVYYYVNVHMGVQLFPLTWQNMLFVSGVIILIGLTITILASLFATGRYIRMKSNTMYEI
jgi:cell division transport system permease protein